MLGPSVLLPPSAAFAAACRCPWCCGTLLRLLLLLFSTFPAAAAAGCTCCCYAAIRTQQRLDAMLHILNTLHHVCCVLVLGHILHQHPVAAVELVHIRAQAVHVPTYDVWQVAAARCCGVQVWQHGRELVVEAVGASICTYPGDSCRQQARCAYADGVADTT
jgi:hypothetical protein